MNWLKCPDPIYNRSWQRGTLERIGINWKQVMAIRQLKLNNRVIQYELVSSRRAKRISVRIREGKVKITIPLGLGEKKAVDFIEGAKERIFGLWNKVHNEQEQRPVRRYENGQGLPFLGDVLVLQIILSRGPAIKIERQAQNLVVSLSAQVPAEEQSEVLAVALEDWYRAQAREILWNKLDHFAEVLGVEYRQFRLKDQKTRWGSCSSQGNINLNWRVILAPERVVDYLVVHELAHLRYLNHSPDFWRVVEAFRPDYRSQRSWLKEHGKELVL